MRRFLLPVLLLLTAAPAQAAAPTSEQKAEFTRVCMSIAQDEALCTCKADAAMTLIDQPFMDVLIAAMKGTRNPAESEYRAYNAYVAKSNQICKPNY
ncbi:hypothetical protein [Devosia submarina]|uniref:hypothetical protein n=1 Tax=Devosia submarina TaxID=1173082 RepID=UPI000D34A908|nr:hypothetical protein [Devosia submarina]